MKEIDFNQINNIQIKDILTALGIKVNSRNQVFFEGFNGGYDDKYRLDTMKTNSVVNFGNDNLPSGRPFNFVKEYLGLDNVDTFKWFKNFLGIIDDNSFHIKERKVTTINYVEKVESNESILENRKNIILQYNNLKNDYYPKSVLDYFSDNRGLSEKTLKDLGAKTGIIKIGEKEYKNRVFFPMKGLDDNADESIVGIKARNIFAKEGYPKSINIKDSEPGLFWDKKYCEGKEHIFFCEGEMDRATLYELGLRNSIGNGSGVQTFKEERKEILKPYSKIYLFYDNDKNGAGIEGMINFVKHNPDKIISIIDYNYLFEYLIPPEFENEIKDINDIHMYGLTTGLSYFQVGNIISKACKEVTLEDLYVISINNIQNQITDIEKKIDEDKKVLDFKIKQLNDKLKSKNELLLNLRKDKDINNKNYNL